MTSTVAAPRPQRDHLIDVLRVAAMSVVVIMHWSLYRVVVADGRVALEPALAGPWAVAATWVLQVMPLFFLCGGFANTVTYDKVRRTTPTFAAAAGTFIGVRCRRLLTPLVPLMVVMQLIYWGAVGLGARGMADVLADQAANVVWFLSVYLVCVALTPLLVTIHERAGWWWLPTALGVIVVLADVARYTAAPESQTERLAGDVNLYVVWLLCHQLGVLYARRLPRRLPASALLVVAGDTVTVMVLAVRLGPYAEVNLGIGGHPEQNLMPPNLVIALLGVLQLCLVDLLARRLHGWRPGKRLGALVSRANLLLMVVFLWHLPALFCVIGLSLLVPWLRASDPVHWWLLRPVWWVLCVVVVAVLAAPVLRWELAWHRYRGQEGPRLTLLGALMGAAGTYLVWREGFAWLERGGESVAWTAVAGQLLVLAAIACTTTLTRISTRERMSP